MSLKIEEMDFDNLTATEKRYLRQRPWLPQPPGDVQPEKTANDWDEDDHETVSLGGIAPSGAQEAEATESGDEDSTGDDGSSENGDEDDDESYASKTVPQLKQICRDNELPVSGTHAELVQRLTDFDEMVANEANGSDEIVED